MSSPNYDKALAYVLQDEGGNDDDPRDHGGRTSRGITQREYNAWCRNNSRKTSDVWHASDADVRTIYHDQYWSPYCDKLPNGLDYLFFDISVNAGRQRAVVTFQKALKVVADGMMGQVTIDAINSFPDKQELIQKVSDERRNWYRHLKQFPIYGKGWLNRVDHSEKGAISLAQGHELDKTPAPAAPSKNGNAQPDSTTISPEASGGTVIAMGGLDVLLKSFTTMLEPYKDVTQYVSYALLGIAVVSMIYAGYGYYIRSKVQAAM